MRKKLTDRMAVLGQGKLRHLLWKDRVSFRKFCLCGYAWPCDKYSPTSLSVAYWQSSFGSAYLENRAPAKVESLQLSESLALSEGVSSLHKQTFHQSIWYQTLESLGKWQGMLKYTCSPRLPCIYLKLWGCPGCSEECRRYSLDPLNLTLQDKWTLSVLSPSPPSELDTHSSGINQQRDERWRAPASLSSPCLL